MQRIAASAPGKAVIAGEYAVLDGAPAIVMAVDRRARVSIDPVEPGPHKVTAPGFADGERRFRDDAGDIVWQDRQASWPLLEHCWRAVAPESSAALGIVLDSREFRDHATGRKLGIGSSAALTAALTQALVAMSAGSGPVSEAAYAAHREFQAGRGSGIDVAASLSGGLLEYCMQGRRTSPLKWPDGLDYAFLWSGTTADTMSRIDRMRDNARDSSRVALAAAATDTVATWRSGSATETLAALSAYAAALAEFSIDHDLGVFDAGHDALSSMARSAGLVYKPCGAGGGDIGIVMGTDSAALAEFVTGATSTGFDRLEIGRAHV